MIMSLWIRAVVNELSAATRHFTTHSQAKRAAAAWREPFAYFISANVLFLLLLLNIEKRQAVRMCEDDASDAASDKTDMKWFATLSQMSTSCVVSMLVANA